MTQKRGMVLGSVDKDAFRRLPNQPLIDPEVAMKNREARPAPLNVYKPAARSAAPIEGAPSIVELARALKYNVDLIFQFVHDNIDFYANYGLHKGGWGALVDGCGNAFDQSDLMVQLLVESGYTASYVLGTIELSATQWSNWLNVSTDDILYAAYVFANGGFGTSYNPTANTIFIDYCWVQCEIAGTNYQFDPALKAYNYTTGIDLASAMGYSQSSFLSDAQSGATVTADSVQNMNQPNISGDLTTYAMNLANWIQTNNPGASFNEILGGRTIVPVSGPVRNATLPYQYGTPTVYSSLPTSVIATLQIQYGSINQTFYTNDIYGYRMSFFWNTSHEAQLYLNLPGSSGNIVATSAAQTIGTSYPCTFTVTHPYASTFANGSNYVELTAGAYYGVGTAWGYAGRQMAEVHRVALSQSANAGDSVTAENVMGESLSITWWNFSGQNSSATQIVNGLSNCLTTFHHNIGVAAFYSDTVFTPGNEVVVNFFFNGWTTNPLGPDANANASSGHVSLLWHMLESAIFTQTPGVPTASAPSVINSANGGSCTATIGGTVAVGDLSNIFVHDSRLSTNPTQVSYTAISGDTTTTIATKLAAAINSNTALAAIGVTATSATHVVRIGSFSYNNTTFTESTTGALTITLAASPGSVIFGVNKANWSTIQPLLSAGGTGYNATELQALAESVATYTDATITGTVASGGGDVLNIFVYDSGLTTNPTEISYTTIAGDTTTTIATKLTAAVNGSSALAALGITATSAANVIGFSSLSPNITTYTQSVTVGSEIITLPNGAYAAINGAVASGGGDVLVVSVYNSALVTNPTQISYTTSAGDTLNTIAANLATLINDNSALSAIGVIAGSDFNILELQSEAANNTTYTAAVTTGSETINLFYSDGETATIAETPYVYVGDYFIGYGYYLIEADGSHFFGPLNNTGKGANSGTISADGVLSGCVSVSVDIDGTGAPSSPVLSSAEPIDLVSGRYLYSNVDISVGNQSDPYQLSFVRSYNSSNFVNNDGLGYGWNHNYQISATSSSDGFIAFGYESVSAAVAAIAEMYVCQDLLESTTPAVPIVNAVTICIANQWLMNQIANNTAVIKFGSTNQVFAKLPNGSYVAPLGVKTSTSLVFNATFTYTTPDKIVYSFNSSGQISSIAYPFGVTITCNYTSSNLTSITNGFRTLTLTYSSGNLSTVTDGNGRTVTYTVTSDELTAFKDALLYSTTYSYASTGLLAQIFRPANPSSAVVTNTYDTLNRVKTQADAYGNVWNYYFAGSRSEEEDPNSNSSVWYLDAFGNPLQYTDQLGNTTVSVFDGLERATLVTLPEGNSTAYTYDAFCNLLSITCMPKPGSGLADITSSFTYDPAWNKVKNATDGNGNTTIYTYDSGTGQLTQIEYPTVGAGTPYAYFTYNSIGQLLTATDPTGIITSFTYNSTTKNLSTQIVDYGTGHLNLTTTFTFDAVGNLATIEDPNSNTTTVEFDANRRLTQITDPTPFNYVTTCGYDHNNNLTEIQSQAVGTVEQTYTAVYTIDSLISSVTEPVINAWGQQPNPTVCTYDSLRRLQTTTDALGNVYTYAYDAMSRIQQITYPDGIVSDTRAYTDNSYIKSVTDANNNETQYGYDGLDRLSTTTYADTTTAQYAYDDNSNVTQITTRSTNTIGFTYDALNETLTKSPQGQATVTYGYDLAGRLTAASVPVVSGDPSTGTFQLYYDTAGRFYKEQYSSGLTVTQALDGNGNVTSITYPDTTVITRSYDQLNRLTGVSDTSGSATFAYDALSRQTSLIYGNGIGCGYFYDFGNNLLSLAFNTSPALQFSYAYNSVHQEVGRQVNNSAYLWQPSTSTTSYGTVNSVNQYPTVGSNAYSYNGNGCLTGDGTLTYTYNTENQLLSITGAGVDVSYEYDPWGRQLLKTVGSTTTQFIYWGLQRIADYTESGTLINRYISSDSLNETLWAESGGATTYLHTDETGSVIFTSNSSGAVTSQPPYDVWGNNTAINSFNIGFTGQRYDPEVGLYYFNARCYSPALGRFLQNDPAGYSGSGLNLYNYCNNDPMNLFDPSGLSAGGGSSFLGIMENVASTVGNVANQAANLVMLPAQAAPESKSGGTESAQSKSTATSDNKSPRFSLEESFRAFSAGFGPNRITALPDYSTLYDPNNPYNAVSTAGGAFSKDLLIFFVAKKGFSIRGPEFGSFKLKGVMAARPHFHIGSDGEGELLERLKDAHLPYEYKRLVGIYTAQVLKAAKGNVGLADFLRKQWAGFLKKLVGIK